jgi:hypothetical protein
MVVQGARHSFPESSADDEVEDQRKEALLMEEGVERLESHWMLAWTSTFLQTLADCGISG